jgi:hypothetical protein
MSEMLFNDDDIPPGPFNLQEQIACVDRELRFRERCYPRWVKEGNMSQQTAQRELECMNQVRRTLRALVSDGK